MRSCPRLLEVGRGSSVILVLTAANLVAQVAIFAGLVGGLAYPILYYGLMLGLGTAGFMFFRILFLRPDTR